MPNSLERLSSSTGDKSNAPARRDFGRIPFSPETTGNVLLDAALKRDEQHYEEAKTSKLGEIEVFHSTLSETVQNGISTCYAMLGNPEHARNVADFLALPIKQLSQMSLSLESIRKQINDASQPQPKRDSEVKLNKITEQLNNLDFEVKKVLAQIEKIEEPYKRQKITEDVSKLSTDVTKILTTYNDRIAGRQLVPKKLRDELHDELHNQLNRLDAIEQEINTKGISVNLGKLPEQLQDFKGPLDNMLGWLQSLNEIYTEEGKQPMRPSSSEGPTQLMTVDEGTRGDQAFEAAPVSTLGDPFTASPELLSLPLLNEGSHTGQEYFGYSATREPIQGGSEAGIFSIEPDFATVSSGWESMEALPPPGAPVSTFEAPFTASPEPLFPSLPNDGNSEAGWEDINALSPLGASASRTWPYPASRNDATGQQPRWDTADPTGGDNPSAGLFSVPFEKTNIGWGDIFSTRR